VAPQTQVTLTEHDPDAVLLCDLREGDSGTVHALHHCRNCRQGKRCGRQCCSCEECELLRAMGMAEKCTLRVCRCGKRCIVQVNSTRLGISSAIARQILVSRNTANR